MRNKKSSRRTMILADGSAKARSDEGKAAEGRRSPRPGGNSERPGTREASWSAPALWRFEGPKALTNLKERFYFPCLPLEVASFKDEQVRLEWLAKNCVADLLERETKQRHAKAKQLEAEQLKDAPARLPHEDMDDDHYEDWRQAVVKLLCKKWPNLCAAMKDFGPANTEQNKQNILSAFIADYRTILGKLPDVKKEDAAELWKDDYYVGLMNKSLNMGDSPVDKILWQLAIGWLAKGCYQMNEKQLAEAFNRDWNYQPGQHKGNTLAKYARDKIGLRFALKRGRPEKPNSLPPG